MEGSPRVLSQSLYEKVFDIHRLEEAFKRVRANRGAAGVDNVDTKMFESKLTHELAQLSKELESWSYNPQPVKRIAIPKPDGGERMLGIPCVRDRVVQTSLLSVLEPIFETKFSENSYGFRPGRNQRQAVEAAQQIVQSGKQWVVDIDLSKFFDRINHDRLIARMGLTISDKRILRLVGMFLRSGVMANGLVSPTIEGSPQGGPLSPLLSNIVLDELDKELERRGLSFCRYADDCNCFVGSEQAAKRVMESVSKFIESKLKLKVNTDKSRVAQSDEVKFLGMTIVCGSRCISKKSMKRAMERTRELIPRGSHQSIEQTMSKVNQWFVGWSNYYRMTEYPAQLKTIESHIRRRFRSRIVGNQKRRRNLANLLLKRGVSRRLVYGTVYSHKGRWRLSHTRALEQAFGNDWFKTKLGFKTMSDKIELEPEWKDIKTWIRLP